MKMKYIVPLITLMIVFLVTACEVPRPGGEADDISQVEPGVPTSAAAATVTPESALTPTTPPEVTPPPGGVAPPNIPDISPEGVPASQAPPADDIEPGTVLVKLTEQGAVAARSAEISDDEVVTSGSSSLDQTLAQIGATEFKPLIADVSEAMEEEIEIQATGLNRLYSVTFPPENNPVDVAQTLEQDPAVEYSEPNFIAGIAAEPDEMPVLLTPNDPYYQFQWHLSKIQMPAAWDRSQGENVTVAIIDTGIDFGAPDLAAAIRLPGYDFANGDEDPTDDHGHGTHVAGTVAQSTNNAVGVAGVAYKARLLPVKVLGSNGQGSYETIINGIAYAVNEGAQVINLSLSGSAPSQALQEAVEAAYNRGVVVVAAAGNSSGPVEYPAAYDQFVIAVGATRFDDTLAPYSNFGPEIDLVAPGGDVDVDQNGDGFGDGVLQNTINSAGSGYSYRFFEGTSMASPHVAGVAALLRSVKASASPLEIENAMTSSALVLGPAGQYGAGLVQAADAIGVIAGPSVQPTTVTPPVTDTSTPTGTPTPTPTDTPTPTFTHTPTPTETPTPTNTPSTPTTEAPTDTPTPTVTPTYTHTPTPTTSPTPTATAGTATASPPITVTSAPPLPGSLLTNGGFETDEGWVFGDTPIRGGYDTNVVRSGNRSARLGATTGPARFSFSSVWQRVNIPAEASQVKLDAFIYPLSQDRASCDYQSIAVLDEGFHVAKFLSKTLSNSRTWEAHSYDLSEFRGRTIYVYFSVLNKGCSGGFTGMYVDDVTLTWSR